MPVRAVSASTGNDQPDGRDVLGLRQTRPPRYGDDAGGSRCNEQTKPKGQATAFGGSWPSLKLV